MSEPADSRKVAIRLSVEQQLDHSCDRFEEEFRAGKAPKIEQFVAEAPESGRSLLLRELIAVQVELRRGLGNIAAAEEYQRKFPDNSSDVRLAFESLLRREKAVGKGPLPVSGIFFDV